MVDKDHPLAPRIRDLVPIKGLDAELQTQVLARGDIIEVKRRRTVFESGTRDAYTFYLLQGELVLESAHNAPILLRASEDASQRALAQLQPRRYTARARTPVNVFRIERAVLDYILSDEQILERRSEVEVEELEDTEDELDWMSRLLSSALFARLPPDHIQRFFAELEPMEVSTGERIVEQGTEGDYLYIVAQGQCAVTRRAPSTGQEIQLALLRDGDSFGEESLISNSPRNASVTMTSDGFLMRLAKREFEELVSRPTLKPVPWSEARKLFTGGAELIDVRFADEHNANAIIGSRNVPLNVLRLEIPKLDHSKSYVVYCDTGARSSTGAFLLAREGFDACHLAGGLDHIPPGEEVPLAANAPTSTTEIEPQAPADEPANNATHGEPKNDVASSKSKTSSAQPSKKRSKPKTTTPPALQRHLEELRAERDRVARFAQQAADSARELKRRYEDLHRAAQQERAQRLAVEQQLDALNADIERQTQMERARSDDEINKVRAKAQEAHREHESQHAALIAEREQTNKELQKALQQIATLEQRSKDEAAARIADREQSERQSSALRSELDAANRRNELVQGELAHAREVVERLELDKTQQTIDREAIKAALASDVETTRQAQATLQRTLDDEREQLDIERKQLDAARTVLEQDGAAQERFGSEQLHALQQREQVLIAREVEIEDLLSTRELELAHKEEALAAEEARLNDEKAAWRTRVDDAIEAERARLESAFEEYRNELNEQARQDVATLMEQRTTELKAQYETQIAELESMVANDSGDLSDEIASRLRYERNDFSTRMAALNRVYNIRLAEQEALLEDEQQRLAAGQVRLREALNETERLKQELRAAHRMPVPTLLEQDVPELPITTLVANGEAHSPSPPPVRREPPVLDNELVVAPIKRDADERARVLSPEQISQIRRKMQEKLAATRRSS